MTLRDNIMPILDKKARGLPDIFGFRQDAVTIRVRVWSGARGDRTIAPVDTDVVLSPNPKTRRLNAREIAGSGGLYRQGDILIGPITPAYDVNGQTGGYTDAQLRPLAANDHTEVIVLINQDEFDLFEFRNDQATKRWITARRKETTP